MNPLKPAFWKALSKWLEHSDQNAASHIRGQRSTIPYPFRSYSKTLYRGTIISEEELEKGFTIKTFTSWSKDQKMAKNFITDSKFSITKNTGTKVLLSKVFTSHVLLDIHSLALFYGTKQLLEFGVDDLAIDSALKEQEVLLDKNIKISQKDIKRL